jgi:hypothetical protein
MDFPRPSLRCRLAGVRRGLVLGAIASLAQLGVAAALGGCGDDQTTGERVVLHTRVVLAEGGHEFTTARGYRVVLSRALLATGPLYYFEGSPPVLARARSPERGTAVSSRASRWLGLGAAWAHPGHYRPGDALGQMLEPSSVDLLAGPATLPDGEGVTGTYRSGRFAFASPPAGPLAGELGGHAAVVIGAASRDGETTRHFAATADVTDIARSVANAEVSGCEFAVAEVESEGTVTLTITPRAWFDAVDFAEVPEGSADRPSAFEPGSQPAVAFAQGLAQIAAYRFSYSN